MRSATIITALSAAAAAFAPAMAAAPTSAVYVMKAGASDMFEIESSKAVMATTNPALKSFAQMMVTDHTQSTADVKAAAMKAGLHPAPPKLDAKQAKDLAALKAAKGTARDKLYVQQQKASHQEALMLQQSEATGGTAPSLKMAAGKIVPVVQHHIQMLSSM